jgi:hypothetical protein
MLDTTHREVTVKGRSRVAEDEKVFPVGDALLLRGQVGQTEEAGPALPGLAVETRQAVGQSRSVVLEPD